MGNKIIDKKLHRTPSGKFQVAVNLQGKGWMAYGESRSCKDALIATANIDARYLRLDTEDCVKLS